MYRIQIASEIFIPVLYNDYSIACGVSSFCLVILLSHSHFIDSFYKLYFTPKIHVNSFPTSYTMPFIFVPESTSFCQGSLELKQTSKLRWSESSRSYRTCDLILQYNPKHLLFVCVHSVQEHSQWALESMAQNQKSPGPVAVYKQQAIVAAVVIIWKHLTKAKGMKYSPCACQKILVGQCSEIFSLKGEQLYNF